MSALPRRSAASRWAARVALPVGVTRSGEAMKMRILAVIVILQSVTFGWPAPPSVTVAPEGDALTLQSPGEEPLTVSVSRTAGLIDAPVNVRVGDQVISFGGFYVRFNGQESGFSTRSVN